MQKQNLRQGREGDLLFFYTGQSTKNKGTKDTRPRKATAWRQRNVGPEPWVPELHPPDPILRLDVGHA
jgi:hypothetical protein